MNFPSELKYTKDHEWVKINGNEATVGITDFAQRELGDIVYLEVNKGIDSAPESVNNDPYGEGWMIKIKMTKPEEAKELLSVEDYKKLIGV